MVVYQEKISDEWNVVRESEKGNVEEEWQLFKSVEVGCREKLYGMRNVGGGVRKGNEYWCDVY